MAGSTNRHATTARVVPRTNQRIRGNIKHLLPLAGRKDVCSIPIGCNRHVKTGEPDARKTLISAEPVHLIIAVIASDCTRSLEMVDGPLALFGGEIEQIAVEAVLGIGERAAPARHRDACRLGQAVEVEAVG